MRKQGRHPHGVPVIAAAIFLMLLAGAAVVVLVVCPAAGFGQGKRFLPAWAAVSSQNSRHVSKGSSGAASAVPPADASAGSTRSVSSARADDFHNAYFIGDSLTLSLVQTTGFKTAGVFASNGMGILDPLRGKTLSGGKTLADSVKAANPARVYILLGANDLTYIKPATYASRYGSLIDALKSNAPTAKIYAQSVFPVTSSYLSAHKISGGTVDALNQALQTLCIQKGATYLNVTQALKGTDGTLNSAYADTGVNLNTTGLHVWLAYLEASA